MELIGQTAALTAAATWAVASIMFARLGDRIGPLTLNLLKCAIALVLLVGTLWVIDGILWPVELGWWETGLLAASGLAGLTLGDTAYFVALQKLGARRSLLLWALTPPLTALLAVPVLGEPITASLLVGMGLTMGGVIWVILERHRGAPRFSLRDEEGRLTGAARWGIAAGIGAAVCQSVGNVLTKLGGAEISALEISVVRLLFGVIGLCIVLGALGRLINVPKSMSSGRVATLVVVATFLGTFLGIWLMNAGLLYTKVGIASTLSSMSPVLVLPLAYLVEGEELSARSILGACIAVGGVAVLFLW